MGKPPPIALGKLYGREVPHSGEAEMCVLGACLASVDATAGAARILAPEHFYTLAHREVFRGVVSVFTTTRDISVVQVYDWLQSKSLIDDVGGREYLERITELGHYAPTWAHFAKIVLGKHRLRECIRICAEATFAAYTDGDDPEPVISGAFERLASLQRQDQRGSIPLRLAVLGVIEDLKSGRSAMMPTGLGTFDVISGGVPRRGVWVVSGGPASGKTTTVLRAALQFSLGTEHEPPRHVRVFSYEQSAQRIAATMLSQESGANVHGALNRTDPLSPDEYQRVCAASADLIGADLHILEGALNAEQIFADCAARPEPGVCIVDYLQLLPPFGQFVEATPRFTESMRVLTRIARECGWLVVVVSQIDKATSKENRAPSISDGLASSAIEQYADLYSTVWRPHQKEGLPVGGTEDDLAIWRARQGRMQLSVVKNKFGPVGVSEVFFEGRSMRVRGPQAWESSAWEMQR